MDVNCFDWMSDGQAGSLQNGLDLQDSGIM